MAITRGLEEGGLDVDCLNIKDVELEELEKSELIGIGSPTHFRRPSKSMREFLSEMKNIQLINKNTFAFETKPIFTMAGSAGNKINKTLKRLKMNIIHPIITGVVMDIEGPLEDDTLPKMEKHGLEIAKKLIDQRKDY